MMSIRSLMAITLFAVSVVGTCCCNAQEQTVSVPGDAVQTEHHFASAIPTGHSAYTLSIAMPVGSLTYGIITKDKKMIRLGLEAACTRVISIAATESYKRLVCNNHKSVNYSARLNYYPTHRGAAYRQTSSAFASATCIALQYKKWYIAIPAYAYAGSVASANMMDRKLCTSKMVSSMVVGTASGLMANWLSKKMFPAKNKAEMVAF